VSGDTHSGNDDLDAELAKLLDEERGTNREIPEGSSGSSMSDGHARRVASACATHGGTHRSIVGRVTPHQLVESTRVVGLLEVDQLVEQHVVDHQSGMDCSRLLKRISPVVVVHDPIGVLSRGPGDTREPGQQTKVCDSSLAKRLAAFSRAASLRRVPPLTSRTRSISCGTRRS